MAKNTKEEKEIKEEIRKEDLNLKKKELKETKENIKPELGSKILICMTLIVVCLTILTLATVFFLRLGRCLKQEKVKNTVTNQRGINSTINCRFRK